MDLLSVEIPETSELHITHPEHGKLFADKDRKEPCIIEVYGPSSDRWIEATRKMNKAINTRMSEMKGNNLMKNLSKIPPEEYEEIENEKITNIVASVKNITLGSEPVTTANIGEVIRDKRFGWIREQLAEKVKGWDGFLG